MRVTATMFVRLLVAATWLAALPAAAADRAHSAPAPHADASTTVETFRLARSAKSAHVIELGEIDPIEIAAARSANAGRFTKRLQIGVGRPVPFTAGARSEALRWEQVPGGFAAQMDIRSSAAHALRVGLDISRLPPSTEIRFAGSGDVGTVYGPFSAADYTAGEATHWSPVLEGERATIEVFVADARSTGEVAFAIAWVSHLFASPSNPHVESLAKAAQACEVDLICLSAGNAALAAVGKSVARMTFVDGGGSFLCTGTLLNTTSGPVAPYFYSANHCINTQVVASTLTTHWFYDRVACGSGGTSPSYVQVAGGATLLYNNANTDVLLLRLNQNPPAAAVYAGWDAATVGAAVPLTGVHHPAGDLKKVSLATAGGFSSNGGGGAFDDYLVSLWNSTATGVTEGGSSGSGIFTAVGAPATEYVLRGGLYGGPSSCTATGAGLRDFYSRFDRAYAFISQYLNPSVSCSYTLTPPGATVGAAPSSSTFSVTAGMGCAWTAASNAGWLAATSSGSGNGVVLYSVAANTGPFRMGTITVGGQAFTVTQATGQAESITSLILNGGFETQASWTQSSTGGFAVINTDSAHSRTGVGYAWLGGYLSGTDTMYQDVALPANASLISLRFWLLVGTTEVGAAVYDTFTVQILNPTTMTVLQTVATASNADAGASFVQTPVIDLTAFKGQTIRLRFTAVNDSTNTTNFFVDDVTLTATVLLDPLADADADGIPNGLEASEGRDANVKDNDVFANARLFAMQQYRDFLGREGDAGGITFYTNGINGGTIPRTQVIENFFLSPEFGGVVAPVTRLYFAFFNRIPDYPGLTFQVNAYRSGTPLSVIAGNFAASPEFIATYGSLNNTQYVTLLYQNVLGRAPSQAEINFYVNMLTSGTSRGQVMLNFSESPEYQNLQFNAVYVTNMYVGMLRRAPEQAGFNYWVGYMMAGSSGQALIAGFLNSPEYHNRFLP